MDMKMQRFGIEIEFTGLTRKQAAQVAAEYFGTRCSSDGGYYDEYSAEDQQGRKWKFMSDGSISPQRKVNGCKVAANRDYAVELVSPICQYDDIPVVQELVRNLRRAGAFSDSSCGIHVHVDAAPFNANSLRNITNIMASKEDLIYKALQVNVSREHQYCKKTDLRWLEELNRKKPKTTEEVSRIWYNGDTSRRHSHYDSSRYRCLNLHSVFSRGTIEFRLFNSDINHAGKIKAYIQFCLAITHRR